MPLLTTHYVYYKLQPQQAEILLPQVCALQQQLRTRHGLRTALHQRHPAGDMLTWMETYEQSADTDAAAFLRDLAALSQQTGLQDAVQGGRKLESFTTIVCDDEQMTKGDARCV